MGALHEGHLALARAAKAECDRAVASIFVNPAQFGPTEDLDRYPRREAEDAAALATLGVELIFAPPVDEMYPDGFATTVTVGGVAERLEGAHRPGHFAGVTTVVSKLLIQARADRAYFGEKDYQQLRVVTRMARDLDTATTIVGVPTVREPDGLALSSRNEYLSPAQRQVAPALNRALLEAAAAVAAGTPCGQQGHRRGRGGTDRGRLRCHRLCRRGRCRDAGAGRAARRPTGPGARRRLPGQDAADRQCPGQEHLIVDI